MRRRIVTEDLLARVVGWRRDLHRRPEVSFVEHDTARYVREALARLPDVDVSQPTPTSVLARIRRGGRGRVVALRSELDALPLDEETELPFRSERPGAMHACGHDAHSAMLLGLAELFATGGATFDGEVRLVFQHAEEKPPGGARELAATEALDGVDAIVGCHLWTGLPLGSMALAPGAFTSGHDELFVTVTGVGGHGAEPHKAVNPVPIAAEIALGVDHVLARGVDAAERLVVTVTQFDAGTATNVIPDHARLGATLRWFDRDVRADAIEKLRRLATGIADAHGATADLTVSPGYDPVVNDAAVTERVEAAARRVLGDDGVRRTPPFMGSEDIGALFARAPGAFFFLGARGDDPSTHFPHHHPRFAIDEACLADGLDVLAESALELLR